MNVTVAKSAGFCFGVRRAVQMVYDEADRDSCRVYTMGPIIHNELVVDDLRKKGVFILNDDLICEETGKPPQAGSVIVIRSHGISRELRQRLLASGCRLVDATCPFVEKIHKIADEKSRSGCAVVIIGNPDHPEVQGIRGWAGPDCSIVETAGDAAGLSFPANQTLCIVSQTTFNYDKFQELVEIIMNLGYHVIVMNTICNATKERQMEALELAAKSDVMIVIGGKNSSNTQKLVDICKSRCENTYYIQTLDDLVTVHFQSESCVGITAGASTPNNIIQEVSTHVRGTKF